MSNLRDRELVVGITAFEEPNAPWMGLPPADPVCRLDRRVNADAPRS